MWKYCVDTHTHPYSFLSLSLFLSVYLVNDIILLAILIFLSFLNYFPFPFSKFLELNLLFLFFLKIDAKIMNFHFFSIYAFRAQLSLYSLSIDLSASYQFYMLDIQCYLVQNICNCYCDLSFVPLVIWNSIFKFPYIQVSYRYFLV